MPVKIKEEHGGMLNLAIQLRRHRACIISVYRTIIPIEKIILVFMFKKNRSKLTIRSGFLSNSLISNLTMQNLTSCSNPGNQQWAIPGLETYKN